MLRTKLRDIYNELERDWQNKQLRLCEKIDELSMELEQAKSRTQNEEIEALKVEVSCSDSIFHRSWHDVVQHDELLTKIVNGYSG